MDVYVDIRYQKKIKYLENKKNGVKIVRGNERKVRKGNVFADKQN